LVGSGIGISSIPNDPLAETSKDVFYSYATNASDSAYILEATLEDASNTVFSQYSNPDIPAAISTMQSTSPAPLTCKAPEYCIML